MLYSTLVHLLVVVLTHSGCYLRTLLGNFSVSPKHLKLKILKIFVFVVFIEISTFKVGESVSPAALVYSTLF